MQGDTPIHRKTFLEMSEDEQLQFITQLRERRLHPINTYKEIREAKRAEKITKLTAKLDKELAMFEKCNGKVEKYLNELQDRANKLRTLKIQIDLE